MNPAESSSLNLLEDLRENGYSVQTLFDPTQVQELIELHQRTRPDIQAPFYTSAFQQDTASRNRVREGLIAMVRARMAEVLPGYRIHGATFVSKKAASGAGMLPLHQDYTFLAPSVPPAITVWAPLCDVNRHNGCLTVVPKSHKMHHIAANPRNPSPIDAIRTELEANYVEVLEMKAGMACFFDSSLLHGSYGNQSDSERTAAFLGLALEHLTPRVHIWDKTDPGKISAYDVSDDFLLYFTPEQPFDEEQKRRVTFMENIDYVPETITVAEIPTKLPFLARTTPLPAAASPAPIPPAPGSPAPGSAAPGLGARIRRFFTGS